MPVRNPGGAAAARRIGVALAATFTLLGCRVERDAEQLVVGEPQPGGTVAVGMRTDFSGFNPVTNTAIYTDEVMKYGLFTPLVQYDDELEVVPYLADSWEMQGDTGVVFRLRQDVRWHDGQPVTAADVKFTFDLAKDPTTGSLIGSAFLGEVASAEVVDAYTIRFDFVRPHAQALESFWWAPLPEHLLRDVPPGELRNADFNRMPVGSGPYRFVQWRANDRLVIERNPDFPAALGGPPYPDRIVFRIIPEPATMMTELITGGIQIDIPLTPEQTTQIQRSPEFELHAFPGRTFYYIGWNTRRPPFTDANVRRAMTLAIDRQEIIDALLFGYGTPATGTIPPWSPMYPDDVAPLPYDPEQAARLLEAAGLVDRTGDGIREDAQGRPFRFALLSSDAPLNRSVVEVVQSQLRRIGVDAQIRVLEFQTLLAQHRAREFDAVLTTWVLDNFQVASSPIALFHSRWADVPQSTNRSSFADPRADRLMDAGATAADPDESREIWREFTLLLQEQQPFTFMFWLDELAASSRRVQNVVMDPRGELLSMPRWWLAGARRGG